MTSINDGTANTPAPATSEQPKAAKKASVAKRARNVAPAKAKSGKKPTVAKKTPKGGAKKPIGGRDGSKASKILDLLKRSDGATLKEIMKAADWQAHSVRGFISGTLGKKMGLTVESVKGKDGERTYSIRT